MKSDPGRSMTMSPGWVGFSFDGLAACVAPAAVAVPTAAAVFRKSRRSIAASSPLF
jgi:hypothetical protein